VKRLAPVAKRLASQGDARKKHCEVSLSAASVEAMNNRTGAMKG